jgi:hypothetical protein
MFAFAERDDRFPFIAALAFGYATDGGEERLFGAMVKGSCTRDRGDGWVSLTCGGRDGVGGRLRHGEFEMDPALQRASLDLSDKRETYRVEWTADGPWGLYQSSEWCYAAGSEEPEGEGHGGGLYQDAIASGAAFGRKLQSSKRWIDHAAMDRGGMVTQCSRLSPRDLDALRAGRYDRVSFEIRRAT